MRDAIYVTFAKRIHDDWGQFAPIESDWETPIGQIEMSRTGISIYSLVASKSGVTRGRELGSLDRGPNEVKKAVYSKKGIFSIVGGYGGSVLSLLKRTEQQDLSHDHGFVRSSDSIYPRVFGRIKATDMPQIESSLVFSDLNTERTVGILRGNIRGAEAVVRGLAPRTKSRVESITHRKIHRQFEGMELVTEVREYVFRDTKDKTETLTIPTGAVTFNPLIQVGTIVDRKYPVAQPVRVRQDMSSDCVISAFGYGTMYELCRIALRDFLFFQKGDRGEELIYFPLVDLTDDNLVESWHLDMRPLLYSSIQNIPVALRTGRRTTADVRVSQPLIFVQDGSTEYEEFVPSYSDNECEADEDLVSI